MVAFTQTPIALLLALATVSNGETGASNLRQGERSLAATYMSSTQYASTMLDRINKERASQGLPPVCSNHKLQAAAQRHGKDQSKTDYMSDYGTDNSTPEQRATDAGYKWQRMAESVDSGNADVDSVVDWWMKNTDRDHILGKYTRVGTAYAYNDSTYNKHYWVQVFAAENSEACDA
jgi:uncharacterized protein YkwD